MSADSLWDRVMDLLSEHYTISQLEPDERFAQVSVSAGGGDVDCGHLRAKNLATDFDGNAAGLFQWEATLSLWVREGADEGESQLRLNTFFEGRNNTEGRIAFRGTETGLLRMVVINDRVTIRCTGTGQLERRVVERLGIPKKKPPGHSSLGKRALREYAGI
ncbi:MAG: hypothetical protein OXE96_08430 [Gemmatimonadetes bacterium]|nr:hypothetical protein [Gemmatimonadota bacterium]